MRSILLISTLLITSLVFSQRGTITGTLEEEGGPLPGATIMVKGTLNGTQTDFDGNYSIECNVGDILVIDYIGFVTREIVVTAAMFGGDGIAYSAPKVEVKPIQNSAYANALKKQKIGNLFPNITNTPYTYTKETGYRSFSRIQNINTKKNVVYLTYFKPDIYIDGSLNNKLAIKNIQSGNLPNNQNTLFQTVFTNNHDARFSIVSEKFQSTINASLSTGRNLYNSNSTTEKAISGLFGYESKIPLTIRVNASSHIDNLANINGFQNLLIQNQFIEPTNTLDTTASLLNTTRSKKTQNHFDSSLTASYSIIDEIDLESQSSITIDTSREQYDAQAGTLGFENAYTSTKEITTHQFQSTLSANTDSYLSDWIGIDTSTNGKYIFNRLDYSFTERNGDIPLRIPNDLTKQVFELKNNATIDYGNFLFLTLSNVSYTSSIQESDWWIPQAMLSFVPTAAFYDIRSEFFNYANISVRYGETVKDSPLLYRNYSHNALTITPENATQFSNRIDLFFNPDLQLEQGKSFEVAASFKFIRHRLLLDIAYTEEENEKGVFPILEGDTFNLKNSANTSFHGLDIELTSDHIKSYDDNFNWSTSVSLSRKRIKVSKLLIDQPRIPVSGFSTINTNLIEGASPGVIVGTAFARDEDNTILTDENGNALVADQSQIIGDPIPDYNIGLSNTFSYKRFELGFTLDYQKGGDIWNGTQKAIEGFAGIDESFIEDGTYLNLKSITASYEFIDKNSNRTHDPFITSLKLSVYTHNIVTWSTFKGATPYSTFFDGASSQGFNFFNTPITSQTGIQIIAKI